MYLQYGIICLGVLNKKLKFKKRENMEPISNETLAKINKVNASLAGDLNKLQSSLEKMQIALMKFKLEAQWLADKKTDA